MDPMRARMCRGSESTHPTRGPRPPERTGTPNVTSIARARPDGVFGPYKGVRRVRNRHKVERYLALDVRKVAVYGLLKPDTEASILLRAPAGNRIASAHLDVGTATLRLRLADFLSSVPTEIRIERTACPFGGSRPWFRCRLCNSRRAILYGPDEDNTFSCRRCMGLVYSSQDERKIDRLYRKQGKLEAKLVGPYCARPKSMHWGTFARISKKLDTVLGKQNRLLTQSARKFLDRHGWPHDAPARRELAGS
jgi:hypothetical protein